MSSNTANCEDIFRATINDGTTFPGVSLTLPAQDDTLSFANGTNAGQTDLEHIKHYGAGTLTLTDGSLKDRLGAAAVFAHVGLLRIINRGLNPVTVNGTFIVSAFGGGTNGIALGASPDGVKPGGILKLGDPGAGVVVSGGQTITLTGTSPSVDVVLTGRSV